MKKSLLPLCIGCLLNAGLLQAAYHNNYLQPEIQPVKCSYDNMKLSIESLRARLKAKFSLRDSVLLEKYFISAVTDSIVPYWYGTAWDFNGATQAPGKGAIACGYFVSTVLRDAGLPVNRVKMGQGSSESASYMLAEKKDIKLFYDRPLNDMITYLLQHRPGLYIIGLDSHVGFILVDTKGIWFIHAKWFDEKAVVKEDAATSSILYYSKYRMLAKIGNSKKLLAAWLFGGSL